MLQQEIDAQIAERTQVLGRQMFHAVRAVAPRIWEFEWFEARMLAGMMHNDALRAEAFEFIAELPQLETDLAIAERIRERFGWLDDDHAQKSPLHDLAPLPRRVVINRTIAWLLRFERLDGWWARQMVAAAKRAVGVMANRFIAGETLDEAERTILKLRRQGHGFTVDLLGEAIKTEAMARENLATYLELIESLSKRSTTWSDTALCDATGPVVNVSVKITALYPGFGEDGESESVTRAVEVLRPLMQAAVRHGAFLNIDMEHYAVKDITLAVCERLFTELEFRDYPHIGMVLQAYLRSSEADLERVLAFIRQRGTRMWVRLVKGAYWDSEVRIAQAAGTEIPVWLEKEASDACYERMTRVMLNHTEILSSAFASHNVRSLCHAAAVAEELGIPPANYEWQMLYGMADPLKRAARRMGQHLRVYTPYGPLMPGIAYLVRRLLENTANESFLRHMQDEGAERALLRDPQERLAQALTPAAQSSL